MERTGTYLHPHDADPGDPPPDLEPPVAAAAGFRPPPSATRRMSREALQSTLVEGDVVAQKYYVDRIVANDGLAIVAHVRHIELGRRHVFKHLPPESCVYPEVVARFLRGARKAQSLQSEHAARMVDAGRLDCGSPYAVSEFMSGGPLSEVLAVRGMLPVTDAVDYVLQAAEAIAEAHHKGLVHKNLSIGRMFLTQQPDGSPFIKVCDFGIADALYAALPGIDYSFETRDPSAYWMDDALCSLAPEQVRNLREIDARTDIWALGTILHHLVTGSKVYQADTLSALFAMIAADAPIPVRAIRSDVPVQLERVILRCLEKDPGARFPTLGELALALKAFALPESRARADRVVRTIGRNPHVRNPGAMVHVGPPVSDDTPPSAPPSLPPRMPPPPLPMARTRPPQTGQRLQMVLLGAGSVLLGVLVTLLLVQVDRPVPAPIPSVTSAVDEQQITVQRELIREIAALRAAREDQTASGAAAGDEAKAKPPSQSRRPPRVPPRRVERELRPTPPLRAPETPDASSSRTLQGSDEDSKVTASGQGLFDQIQ